jgi:hypothetical protein
MAALKKKYLIQRGNGAGDAGYWYNIPFQHGSRDYADGYVDAMDSMYPSHPYRIITYDKEGHVQVYRETRGRSHVRTNKSDLRPFATREQRAG